MRRNARPVAAAAIFVGDGVECGGPRPGRADRERVCKLGRDRSLHSILVSSALPPNRDTPPGRTTMTSSSPANRTGSDPRVVRLRVASAADKNVECGYGYISPTKNSI